MDFSTLLMTKAGGVFLLLCMAAFIVVLLRLLYGPRGFFRDPQWDALNDDMARRESRLPSWMRAHMKQFTAYSKPFFTGVEDDDMHLRLKQDHTEEVLENAVYIAAHEDAFFPRERYRALLLAALYHDVGRFWQYAQFKTFSDAHSCNHGILASRLIRQHGFLRDESPAVRKLARTGVCLHNVFQIKGSLSEAALAVLHGVRDADKLDILRVMAGHIGAGKTPDAVVIMHLQNVPGQYSPAILEAVDEGRLASFLDMRFVNDFRLLICTWVTDLHYAATRKKAAADGHLETIIDGFDGEAEVRERVRSLVRQRLQA